MHTALITGGHGGIGLSAARELASRYKWNLLLAGRSPDRMARAAEDLRRDFGVSVATVQLDTSSLHAVRTAAAEVTRMLESGALGSLDALLCNAGGRFDGPVSFSPEGYELTFATNCLGHFLLANLLCGGMADGGRIVFTASGTHDPDTVDGRMVGRVVEPDADVLASTGKPGTALISVGKRYSTSKLCTVLNAYELDRRLRTAGRSLGAFAFDPGSVPETGFLRGLPGPIQSFAKSSFMHWLSRRLGVTTGSVAFSGAALARVAADPAYAGGSGKYFQCNDGKLNETRSSTISYDERRAAKLWKQMEALVTV